MVGGVLEGWAGRALEVSGEDEFGAWLGTALGSWVAAGSSSQKTGLNVLRTPRSAVSRSAGPICGTRELSIARSARLHLPPHASHSQSSGRR